MAVLPPYTINSAIKAFKEIYEDYDWSFIEQELYTDEEYESLKLTKLGKVIGHEEK